ncbi:MAG: hypothetical protein JWP88_109 [Flaviaesturariibacter sp.]|nr:hypothetical protein [Flaviaesturariibacter sp.]
MNTRNLTLLSWLLLPLMLQAQRNAAPSLQRELANAITTDSLTISVQTNGELKTGNYRIMEYYKPSHTYLLQVPKNEVGRLLQNPQLLFADLSKTAKEELTTGTLDITVNKINFAQHRFPAILGDGINASVKEQQFDTADIDYKNRVFNSGQASGFFTAHASIMATILAGAANSSPFAKGAATGTVLTSANFTTLLPQPDSIYQRYKISVQNHSYGTAIENYYGVEASAYDASAVNNPSLLHVFSSGNSGTAGATSGAYTGLTGFANLTGNFKMAKNNLVVGATDSFAIVAALSSKGPAHDGRVKPELVAFGEDGSSGAAAMTSGAAALVQHAYKSLHNGALPSSALVKATLLNGADDVGASHVDYSSGYGSLNAYNAVEAVMQNRLLEDAVANGQIKPFTLMIPAGVKQLKLTLAWTDPATTANSSKALINDLDATLKLPATGDSWLPWVLDPTPAAIQLPAQRKRDTLNNVEQITIDNPVAGSYTLEIKGSKVVAGNQAFVVAYQIDTVNQFYFTFPTSDDQVVGGKTAILHWQSNVPTNGQLEYTTNGVTWQSIATVDLRQQYYRWSAPSAFSVAQLRMKVSGLADTISDSFVISNAPAVVVGFNCTDSFLLHWNALPSGRYQLYELGTKYLQPFAITADTSIVLKKSQHPSLYYAVAPVVAGKPGLKSFTVKYDAQGVECYFRNFYVQLQQDNTVNFSASIGSLYNVSSIAFQKLSSDVFTTLQTVNNPTGLDFTFNYTGLSRGINYFRLQIKLSSGAVISSEVVPVYYYPDLPVIVYPNPVAQNQPIRVLSQEPGRYTIQVFDVSGRTVHTQRLMDVTNAVPSLSLAKGVYFIRITSEAGPVATEKVVVY